MEDKDLQLDNHGDPQPWDSGFYETGATKPPKNNGGLLAIMLVGGIFLGSVLNSLGLFGFQRDTAETDKARRQESIAFIASNLPSDIDKPVQPRPETAPRGESTLQLHKSPKGKDNLIPDSGISYQHIYQKNIDSVVSITCQLTSGKATGSGVVVTADGYIVTNAHVVENADTISVLLSSGKTCAAYLVGTDALSDLAVLKIQENNLKPAEFGDSSVLQVGDPVVAIGDPLGVELRGTMTDGIVSGLNRVITTGGRPMTLIQTNAALNSGNSGGPLINCYGQVVGINTMKISRFVQTAAPVEGIGFAIPSTTVKEIVDQLICQGYVTGRPSLGMDAQNLSTFNQRFYHLPAGLYVYSVWENSDAKARGFQAGDIILTIDNVRLNSEDDLQKVLFDHQVGDTVDVVFYRSGRQYSGQIVLEQAR